MRKIICALLLAALMATACAALAEDKLTEVIMIYEDYDGHRAEQTVNDDETLQELEAMLLRAGKHKAELENCTMNSSLFCMLEDGTIYDFAVATDGCPYITDMETDQTYRLEDADSARLWEIFDLVQEEMGFDAALVLGW